MTSSHSALEPEQKAEARRARERPEAKPGDRGGTAARWEAERVFRGSVTARPWEVFYIDVAPASTGERAASSCIERGANGRVLAGVDWAFAMQDRVRLVRGRPPSPIHWAATLRR